MRIAVFTSSDSTEGRVGIVCSDAVTGALTVYPAPEGETVLGLLAVDQATRAIIEVAAREQPGHALADVQLLAPIQPPAMRDFLTFEEHVSGTSRAMQGEDVQPEWYEAPSFLFMSPHAVVATGTDVEIPHGTHRMDFELELAAVVCRDAKNITDLEAEDHIGGYLIMNDWSARDIQRREMKLGLGPSKGKDFATTLGPWIVTSDELEAYRHDGRLDLAMTVSVNGKALGGDRSLNMGWSFEQMVSYAARGAWVMAGDVLASGTCHNGALAESWGRSGVLEPPPLQPGDTVTMSIEGIGEITNRVVEAAYADLPIPSARKLTTHA